MTKQEEIKPLEMIIDKIQEKGCIYNIHYCNAGWGFIMYYPNEQNGEGFRKGLSVEQYYGTLRQAAEETLEMLEAKDD